MLKEKVYLNQPTHNHTQTASNNSNIMKHIYYLLLVLLLSGFITNTEVNNIQDYQQRDGAKAKQYDIIVIGGTPAGVAAAIAAGRSGKRVIIIEQSPVLGGVLASGVLRMDDYYIESNSGVIEEFRQRVSKYHRTTLADDPLVKAHLKQYLLRPWNVAAGRAWEPHTAARIFAEMVAEQKSITTRFNEVAIDVKLKGKRVTGVITQDRDNKGNLGEKHTYFGKVIIDATYETDLAEYAKIPFRIGREARSVEEPHAGVIYTNFFRYVKDALPATVFPGSTGEADHRSQAFTYRMTAKDYGKANHPYLLKQEPPDYNRSKYKWNGNREPIIPNKKFDLLGINWGGDLTGFGTRWVLADWEERFEIEKNYHNYELGWLYYIQTEGGSPNIGLPDDEFMDNNNFPYRLYVRQGRRIEGLYTLTESDMHKDLRGDGLRGPLNRNSIAIGIYGIDAHNVQNPTVREEPVSRETAAEGTLHLHDVTGPYQIPYGVMIPKEHKGIIFPIGISSTHVAMSSVRMEPVWSQLGQAAGVAAALAIDNGIDLADVPVHQIQDELIKQGSVVFFYTDLPAGTPSFEAVQKLSLLHAIDHNSNMKHLSKDGPILGLTDTNKEAYRFRPDDLITLGEFAQMAVNGFQVPLSITAAHFIDAPRGHPSFKFIETLYDNSTQSVNPFFEYEIQPKTFKVRAHPEQHVDLVYARRIISGLLQKPLAKQLKPNTKLTRGEAAQVIYEYTKK
mgnify:CR=1 FL=1